MAHDYYNCALDRLNDRAVLDLALVGQHHHSSGHFGGHPTVPWSPLPSSSHRQSDPRLCSPQRRSTWRLGSSSHLQTGGSSPGSVEDAGKRELKRESVKEIGLELKKYRELKREEWGRTKVRSNRENKCTGSKLSQRKETSLCCPRMWDLLLCRQIRTQLVHSWWPDQAEIGRASGRERV